MAKTISQDKSTERRGIWIALRIGIVAAVLLAYSPLFTADFSGWDDRYNIVENPHLNPPTLASIGYYWTHSAYDLYIPVTYTLWAGIAQVAYVPDPDQWGSHLNSYLFHAANIFVHAGAALLVLEILRTLFRNSLSAGVGAFLFALHPVQVESVGWVAGFKDVLAGFFALLSLHLYFKADTVFESNERLFRPKEQTDAASFASSFAPFAPSRLHFELYFAFATLCFILAMLSKPIALVTPAIALAIDLVLYRKLRWRLAIWFALSLVCAIIATHTQLAEFAIIKVPLWQRPFVAGDAIAFYLYKLIWPARLCIDYGRSPRQTLATHWPYFTTLVPITLAIVLIAKRRAWAPIAAGAIVFVLAMLPVLGLVRFDFQLYSTVSDHYLYLPMLGVAIVAAFVVSRIPRSVAMVCAVSMLAVLSVRTWLQCQTWSDGYTLFNHVLAVNPKSWMAHSSLAAALMREHHVKEAEVHLRESLALRPDVDANYANLGEALRQQGKNSEAIGAYRKDLQYNQSDFVAWTGLGHALSEEGDLAGAIDAYAHAMNANPTDPATRSNLASALAEHGDLPRAIELYESALKLKPDFTDAAIGLARAKRELQQKRSATTRSKTD